MIEYRFAIIIEKTPENHDDMLNAADALGDAGCTDASLRGHPNGMELLFERSGDSLQSTLAAAIANVESAGFRVLRVEMEREAILH